MCLEGSSRAVGTFAVYLMSYEMHRQVRDVRTWCCSFCKVFSCCDERQKVVLEIFQSVVREGEEKHGKGRGI